MKIDPAIRIEHRVEALSKPTAHYSEAVSYGGLYYIAGVLPVDKTGALFGGDDITAQAEQVFGNIEAALQHAGSGFGGVLKTRVFVTSIGDRAKIDAVRRAVFGQTKPVSTLVEIGALAVPDAKIKIEATDRRSAESNMLRRRRRASGPKYLTSAAWRFERFAFPSGIQVSAKTYAFGTKRHGLVMIVAAKRCAFAIFEGGRDSSRRLRGWVKRSTHSGLQRHLSSSTIANDFLKMPLSQVIA